MFNPKVDDKWFYSEPGRLARTLGIYVKGDLISLLPVIIGILLSSIVSLKFMILMYGFYILFRGLGEMIYWLLQQFGPQTYRPESRFKNIGNNSVYIIYQTAALRDCMIGIAIVTYILAVKGI